MSARYRTWQRVARLLEVVRLQRDHITRVGESCSAWESIGDHAAEVEREARLLALESGCETHLEIRE